jgi:hypothetical protein
MGGCALRGRIHAPSGKPDAHARQELFPQSYAQTAAWLQRERTANQDTLARCRAALQAALGSNAALQPLVAGCQVRRGGRRPWTHTLPFRLRAGSNSGWHMHTG